MDFVLWAVIVPSTGCPIRHVTDNREEAEHIARLVGGRVVRLSEAERME